MSLGVVFKKEPIDAEFANELLRTADGVMGKGLFYHTSEKYFYLCYVHLDFSFSSLGLSIDSSARTTLRIRPSNLTLVNNCCCC